MYETHSRQARANSQDMLLELPSLLDENTLYC
jgi:hypothetical protein